MHCTHTQSGHTRTLFLNYFRLRQEISLRRHVSMESLRSIFKTKRSVEGTAKAVRKSSHLNKLTAETTQSAPSKLINFYDTPVDLNAKSELRRVAPQQKKKSSNSYDHDSHSEESMGLESNINNLNDEFLMQFQSNNSMDELLIQRTVEVSSRDVQYKLMFVGQGRAGKTATIRNILGELFSDHIDSTVGIDEFSASISMAAVTSQGRWEQNGKPDSELAYGVATNAMKQKFGDQLHPVVTTVDSPLSPMSSTTPSLNPSLEGAVTEEVVMKCFSQNSMLNDVMLAIYDYGGQSVFNVIHHLFLTTNGLYLVVFNMQWLLSDDEQVQRSCVQNLRFWLQSVYIHTYQEDLHSTAPVILVGTRGDVVSSETEYATISAILYEELFHIMTLLALVPNTNKGLSFFPVDNTAGNSSSGAISLMNAVERVVDGSEDAHREIPLLWLRTLDMLQDTKKPCISYDEVCDIAVGLGIEKDLVVHILQFWRNLGMLLWINEPGLQDVVVLDAIQYLVVPATRIICKHAVNTDAYDDIIHHSERQADCARLFPVDWAMLQEHGILSDSLLRHIWADRRNDKENLLMLMAKFGLLMPVIESSEDRVRRANPTQTLYLIPALLPKTSPQRLWTSREGQTCLFLFMPRAHSGLQSMHGCIEHEDRRRFCFLPIGLFERVIVRVISWCQSQLGSSFSLRDVDLDKNTVVLPFGRYLFRLVHCPIVDCIRLDVTGNNVLSVYQRVVRHIEVVLSESFQCLNVYAMRLAAENEDSQAYDLFTQGMSGHTTLLFLDQLQSTIESGQRAFFCHRKGAVSKEEIIKSHGFWIKPTTSSSSYDVFISYRWNEWDKILTASLYDALSYFTLGDEGRNLNIFVDEICLMSGTRFDQAFARAVVHSQVAVPIVSVDALERLLTHNAAEIDNLLLEWIIMLVCINSTLSLLRCIYPIMIGRRSRGTSISGDIALADLFIDKVFCDLSSSSVVPSATLSAAKMHLRQHGIILQDEISFDRWRIKDIVHDGILKFLGYKAWERPSRDLCRYCAPQVLKLLREGHLLVPSINIAQVINGASTSTCCNPLILESKFLSQEKNFKDAWELIKDGAVATEKDRPQFLACLDELGIDDAESLEYIYVKEKDEFRRVLNMMKLAKRYKIRDLLNISEDY